MEEEFGLSREQLASIFRKLGDKINAKDIHFIMRGTTSVILVESAYSGSEFYWTIKKLRTLERLTKLKIKMCGGAYCRINIELQKP